MAANSGPPASNPAIAYLNRHAARITTPISLIELDNALLGLAHPCFVPFCSGQPNGQEGTPRLRTSPTDLPAPDTATLCANKVNLAAGLAKTRVFKGLLVGLWLPQGPEVEETPAQEGRLPQARRSNPTSPYVYPVIKPAEGQPVYPVCVTMNTAAAIRRRAAFYVLTEPDQGGVLHGFWNVASMDDTFFFPAYRDDITRRPLVARKSCVNNLVYRAFKDLGNQDGQPLEPPKPPQPARSQHATRLSTGARARANYCYEPINFEMDAADESMADADVADESTIRPVEEPIVEPAKMPDDAAEDMADQDLLWVLIKNPALKITKQAVFEAWEDFAIQHPDFIDSLTNGFETEEPSMSDITAMVHGLRTVDPQVPIVYLRPWAYAFLEVWNKWPNMPESSDGQKNLASTVAKQTYSFVKGQLGRSVERMPAGSYGA